MLEDGEATLCSYHAARVRAKVAGGVVLHYRLIQRVRVTARDLCCYRTGPQQRCYSNDAGILVA